MAIIKLFRIECEVKESEKLISLKKFAQAKQKLKIYQLVTSSKEAYLNFENEEMYISLIIKDDSSSDEIINLIEKKVKSTVEDANALYLAILENRGIPEMKNERLIMATQALEILMNGQDIQSMEGLPNSSAITPNKLNLLTINTDQEISAQIKANSIHLNKRMIEARTADNRTLRLEFDHEQLKKMMQCFSESEMAAIKYKAFKSPIPQLEKKISGHLIHIEPLPGLL